VRLTRRSSWRRETIVLNLASMIDVTFLLLLYFLVTTVLAQPEDRLSPSLRADAEAEAGPDADFQPQVVEVRLVEGAAAFRLGAQVFRDRQALTTALEPLHKPSGLFVKVFDEVPVAAAAAAIQAGRDAGFERLTYVAAK
jgi:biopolymer transport protein ExbD